MDVLTISLIVGGIILGILFILSMEPIMVGGGLALVGLALFFTAQGIYYHYVPENEPVNLSVSQYANLVCADNKGTKEINKSFNNPTNVICKNGQAYDYQNLSLDEYKYLATENYVKKNEGLYYAIIQK